MEEKELNNGLLPEGSDIQDKSMGELSYDDLGVGRETHFDEVDPNKLAPTLQTGMESESKLNFDYDEFKDYIRPTDDITKLSSEDLIDRRAKDLNPFESLSKGELLSTAGNVANLWAKNAGRGLTGVPIKIAEGLTAIAGVPLAIVDYANNEDSDQALKWLYDNKVQRALSDADKLVKEFLPIYKSIKKDPNATIFEEMGTADFWKDLPNFLAEDLQEGVQFAQAAMFPTGIASKAAKGAGFIGKTANKIALAGVQTIGEAAVEAKGVLNDGKVKYAENLYHKKYEELEEEEKNDVDSKSSEAAANTFKGNAALLMASNLIENSLLFGKVLNPIKAKKLSKIGDLFSASKPNVLNSFKKPMKDFIANGFREGVIEEGLQTAMSGYYTNAAQSGKETSLMNDVTGITDQWIKGFGTAEGSNSMFLGALIGGSMSSAGARTRAKEDNAKIQADADRYDTFKQQAMKDVDRLDDIYTKMNDITKNPDLSSGQKEVKLRTLKDELFKVQANNSFKRDVSDGGVIYGDHSKALVDEYKKIQGLDNTMDLFQRNFKPQIDQLQQQVDVIQQEAKEENRELTPEEQAILKESNDKIKDLTTKGKEVVGITEAQAAGVSSGLGDNAYKEEAAQTISQIEELSEEHSKIVKDYSSLEDYSLGLPDVLFGLKSEGLIAKQTAKELDTEINTALDEYEELASPDLFDESIEDAKKTDINRTLLPLKLEIEKLSKLVENAVFSKDKFENKKMLTPLSKKLKALESKYLKLVNEKELTFDEVNANIDETSKIYNRLDDLIEEKVTSDSKILTANELYDHYTSNKGLKELRTKLVGQRNNLAKYKKEVMLQSVIPNDSLWTKDGKEYQVRKTAEGRKLFEKVNGAYIKATNVRLDEGFLESHSKVEKAEVTEEGKEDEETKAPAKREATDDELEAMADSMEEFKKANDPNGLLQYYKENVQNKYSNETDIAEAFDAIYNELTDSNINNPNEADYVDKLVKDDKGEIYVARSYPGTDKVDIIGKDLYDENKNNINKGIEISKEDLDRMFSDIGIITRAAAKVNEDAPNKEVIETNYSNDTEISDTYDKELTNVFSVKRIIWDLFNGLAGRQTELDNTTLNDDPSQRKYFNCKLDFTTGNYSVKIIKASTFGQKEREFFENQKSKKGFKADFEDVYYAVLTDNKGNLLDVEGNKLSNQDINVEASKDVKARDIVYTTIPLAEEATYYNDGKVTKYYTPTDVKGWLQMYPDLTGSPSEIKEKGKQRLDSDLKLEIAKYKALRKYLAANPNTLIPITGRGRGVAITEKVRKPLSAKIKNFNKNKLEIKVANGSITKFQNGAVVNTISGFTYVMYDGNIIPTITKRVTDNNVNTIINLLKLYVAKGHIDANGLFIAGDTQLQNEDGSNVTFRDSNNVEQPINIFNAISDLVFYTGNNKAVDGSERNKNPNTKFHFVKTKGVVGGRIQVGDNTFNLLEQTEEGITLNSELEEVLRDFLPSLSLQVNAVKVAKNEAFTKINSVLKDGTVTVSDYDSYNDYLLENVLETNLIEEEEIEVLNYDLSRSKEIKPQFVNQYWIMDPSEITKAENEDTESKPEVKPKKLTLNKVKGIGAKLNETTEDVKPEVTTEPKKLTLGGIKNIGKKLKTEKVLSKEEDLDIKAKKADIEKRREEELAPQLKVDSLSQEVRDKHGRNTSKEIEEGRANTKIVLDMIKKEYDNKTIIGKLIRVFEKLIDFNKFSITVNSGKSSRIGEAAGSNTNFGMTISPDTSEALHNTNSINHEKAIETVIHELTHAITSNAIHAYQYAKETLSAKQIKAVENLFRIFEKVKKANPKVNDYGFTNLDEFLSEVFSNSKFRILLQNTKSEGKTTSIFKDIVDTIKDLLYSSLEKWAKKFNKSIPNRNEVSGITEDVFGWTEDLLGDMKVIKPYLTDKEINAKYDAELAALESNRPDKINLSKLKKLGIKDSKPIIEESVKDAPIKKEVIPQDIANNPMFDITSLKALNESISKINSGLQAETNDVENAEIIAEETSTVSEPIISKEALVLTAAERRAARKAKIDAAKKTNAADTDTYFRRRNTNTRNYVKEDLEKAEDWFIARFPNVEFKIVQDAIQNKAYGALIDSTVHLWKEAEVGTTYHEAFHTTSQLFLNTSQRGKLYNEWRKANKSDATNSEVEEALAEEFRDFVLDEGKSKYATTPKKQNFFKRVWKFIKNVIINDKSSEIEKVFNRIDQGYYKDKSPKRNKGTLYSAFKGGNVFQNSHKFRNDVINATNFYFFNIVDSKYGGVLGIFNSDINSAKVYESILAKYTVKLADLYDELEAAESDRYAEGYEDINEETSDIEFIVDNFAQVINEHAKYLQQYGIATSLGGIGEESIVNEMGEEERTGKSGWQQSDRSIHFSAKKNAAKLVRLRINQLAIVKRNPTTKARELVHNDLGLPQTVPFGKTFSLLVNELSGITSLEGMAAKIKNLATYPDYVHMEKLYEDFQLDKVSDKEYLHKNPDVHLGMVQLQQTFRHYTNKFEVDYTGNKSVKILDANSNTLVVRTLNTWKGKSERIAKSTHRKFYGKNFSYNYAPFAAIQDNIKEKARIRLPKFYSALGIDFTYPDRFTSKQWTRLDDIADFILKNMKQDKQVYLFSATEANDIVGMMNEVVEMETSTNPNAYENSHVDGKKNTVYNHTLFNHLTWVTNIIDKATTLDQVKEQLPYLFDETYSGHSKLLQQGGFLFDEQGNKKANMKHVIASGSREEDSSDYKDYEELSDADRLRNVLARIKQGGYFNLLRTADKKLENFLQLPVSSKNYQDTFKGYLIDEINSFKELKGSKEDYTWRNLDRAEPTGILLSFFKEVSPDLFKALNDKLSNPSTVAEVMITEKGIVYKEEVLFSNEDIAGIVDTYINNTVDEVIDKLVSNNVLAELKDKYINNGLVGIADEVTKDKLIASLRNNIIEDLIMGVEQTKVLFGNPVAYKTIDDFFKRAGSLPGTKKLCMTDSYINEFIKTSLKRTDGMQGKVDSRYGKPIIRTAIHEDVLTNSRFYEEYKKALGEKVADGYLFMEEGDGHSVCSLDYFREHYYRSSDWSFGVGSLEDKYQYDMQKYYASNRDLMSDAEFKETFGYDVKDYSVPKVFEHGKWRVIDRFDLVDVVYNNIKPQYFGAYANVKGFKQAIYKTQFHPITPDMANNYPNVKKMMSYMRENGVSIVSHYSANKGITTKVHKQVKHFRNEKGELQVVDKLYLDSQRLDSEGIPIKANKNAGQVNQLYDENGNFGLNKDSLTQDIYFESMGTQVDTGFKSKSKVVTGTQMMKQVITAVFSNGVAANTALGAKVSKYLKLNSRRIELGKEELLRELKIEKEGDVYKVKDFEKFKSKLKKELIGRDAAENMIEAVDLLGETRGMDVLINRARFEPILFSLADSGIIRQKRFGKASYQTASTLYETKATRNFRMVKGKQVFDSNDLDFYLAKDGTVSSMEVYLPSYMEGITNIGDVVDSRLGKIIGFRIPTQGLNSIESMKVKGFLPKSAGDVVVLPTEIVAKAGSDYDIDKLNLYIPNFYMDTEGDPIYLDNTIKYEDYVKEIAGKPKSREVFERLIVENEITELQHEIITAPDNYQQLMTSIDSDLLKKTLVNEISLLKTGEARSKPKLFKMIQRGYLNDVAKRFLGGKAAVGITALASTFHIMAQLYGLKINDYYLEYDKKKNKNVKKPSKLNLQHNKEGGKIALGGLKDSNSKHDIPFVLSLWINAAVDAAKDPFMFDMNVNLQTLNTVLYLTMAGVPTETIMYFVNQPILVDYIANQNKFESQVAETSGTKLFKNEIIKLTVEKYSNTGINHLEFDKRGNLSHETKTFTDTELRKMIKDGSSNSLTAAQKEQQLQVLDDFLRYQSTATHIREANQGIGYDTSSFGKNLTETLLKMDYTKKAYSDGVIMNFAKMLSNNELDGFAAPYYNGVKDTIAYYTDLFEVLKNPKLQEVFNTVKSIYTSNATKFRFSKQSTALDKFVPDFLTYITSNTTHTINGNTFNINEESEDIFKTVAKQVNDIKLDFSDRDSLNYKKYGQNKLIDALIPILDFDNNEGFLKVFMSKLDSLDSNELTEAWESLLQEGSLGVNLIKLVFKQAGLQNSPMNFIELMPSSIYGDMLDKALNENSMRDKREYTNFIFNWMVDNYSNNEIVPKGIKGYSAEGYPYQYSPNKEFPIYKLFQVKEMYANKSDEELDILQKSGITIVEPRLYWSGTNRPLTDIKGYNLNNFTKDFKNNVSKKGLGSVDFMTYFSTLKDLPFNNKALLQEAKSIQIGEKIDKINTTEKTGISTKSIINKSSDGIELSSEQLKVVDQFNKDQELSKKDLRWGNTLDFYERHKNRFLLDIQKNVDRAFFGVFRSDDAVSAYPMINLTFKSKEGKSYFFDTKTFDVASPSAMGYKDVTTRVLDKNGNPVDMDIVIEKIKNKELTVDYIINDHYIQEIIDNVKDERKSDEYNYNNKYVGDRTNFDLDTIIDNLKAYKTRVTREFLVGVIKEEVDEIVKKYDEAKLIESLPRNEEGLIDLDQTAIQAKPSISQESLNKSKSINIYWGGQNSSKSENSPERLLSNLASRKFNYESTDGVSREYGSVEHAYQTNKNGKFDKVTYDKYIKAGGYGTTDIDPKLTDKGKRGNLQLMKDLVVDSFLQDSTEDKAPTKALMSYSEFTHNTNEIIDKAFLEGLKLAQQEVLDKINANVKKAYPSFKGTNLDKFINQDKAKRDKAIECR